MKLSFQRSFACVALLAASSGCVDLQKKGTLESDDTVVTVANDSGDLTNFIQNFVELGELTTDKAQLDGFAALLEQARANVSGPDATDAYKIVVSQFLLLEALEGIVWRTRLVFEDDSDSSAYAQNAFITLAQQLVSVPSLVFPTKHWNVVWKWLTYPKRVKDGENAASVANQESLTAVPALQAFVSGELYSAVKSTADFLAGISLNQPIQLDNALITGVVDESAWDNPSRDRFPLFSEADRLAVLSNYYQTLHNFKVFAAFNLDKIVDFNGKIALRFVTKTARPFGLIGADLSGLPNKERVLPLKRESVYGSLFTVEDAAALDQAFTHLQQAIETGLKAKATAKGVSAKSNNVLNALAFQNDQARSLLEAGSETLQSLVLQPGPDGFVAIKSPTTEAVVQVNLKAMYSLPQGFDLKSLLPTAWDEEKFLDRQTGFAYDENRKPRNYRYGMPTAWNPSAWAPFLRGSGGGTPTNGDIEAALQALSQNWGSAPAAGPLFALVL